MGKTVRGLMTDDPCAIDADKSVAYAAKMMRDEDVDLAPIVEGDVARHGDDKQTGQVVEQISQ